MQTSATNKRLRQLLTGIRDGTLVPNPHFQRRLVWSNHHKVAFIQTVLDGLPFPEIFISAGTVDPNTGDGTELIVDGQQRITSLYQYFSGSQDLRLTALPSYAQLTDEEKLSFLEYEVVIRDLGALTEDETRSIFQRINSTNYSLNAMEVNNSRFDGALKRFAEDVASASFFRHHKVFTNLDGRRMNDVRFALTIVISLVSGYFNRDDEHETYLERFNDSFPDGDDVRNRLERVFHFLEACNLPPSSRAWRKADLLTLVVELDRLLNVERVDLDPLQLSRALNDFYDDVNAVTHAESPSPEAAEYYRRVRSGINDRVSRINRAETLQHRLRDTVLR
jgi:hypothetical protein